MREHARAKADRLLTSGRVVITHVDGRYVRAIVRGDTEGFHVVEHADGRWTCDCTGAPYGRGCSHRLSVMLVTAPVGISILAPDLMVGAT